MQWDPCHGFIAGLPPKPHVIIIKPVVPSLMPWNSLESRFVPYRNEELAPEVPSFFQDVDLAGEFFFLDNLIMSFWCFLIFIHFDSHPTSAIYLFFQGFVFIYAKLSIPRGIFIFILFFIPFVFIILYKSFEYHPPMR